MQNKKRWFLEKKLILPEQVCPEFGIILLYTEEMVLKHCSPDMETRFFRCFTESSWRKPM
jgi:hypothetical protein